VCVSVTPVSHYPSKTNDEKDILFISVRNGVALWYRQGNFKIAHLAAGTYEVDLHMIGYAPVKQQVTVNGDATLSFTLAVAAQTLTDVVITSLGYTTSLRRAPVPVTVISHEALTQQASTNVIDALASQPGITQVTTGPGVSKPEINGLGYNRVLTLVDGERQEDFQWGDEHGILIDPYMIYSAEIIRGPASLQYGANAVAGVIGFKTEPLPEVKGAVQGSFQSEFQTNTGLIGNSLDMAGNTGGMKWDARGSMEYSHCYWDPKDGYVWGTAWQQENARIALELDKGWGYSKLTASHLHRQIEIPDGNRDSATGRFEFDVPRGAEFDQYGNYISGTGKIFPTLSNFLSYKPNISGYQILYHDEVWWQNSINVGGKGKIGADLGYTQSIRHEIDTGTVGGENMIVHDIPYNLRYQMEDVRTGIKLTTGLNGLYEFENNYPEPPSPYIGDFEIPNYHIFDIGGYGILEKSFQRLTLSGGLRYDLRSIKGDAMYLANYDETNQTIVPAGTAGAYEQFPAFNNTYRGFSGSVGASYELPKNFYIKLNFARSFRAPAINELTSNELDPSNMFKQGDPNLKPETGYEVDLAFGKYGKDVDFEIDPFYNYINNFIFTTHLASVFGGDSIDLGAPVYKYTSATAYLTGVSLYLKIHPASAKWFEWDNGFSYIYSFLPGQTDSTRHVPFTPAPKLTSEFTFRVPETSGSIFHSSYVRFGLAYYWAQKNIYSALYDELPSLAYGLFDASIGTNFVNPRTRRIICSFMISGTNLMNIAYIDHLSRPQYFWAYNGYQDPTNFGAAASVVTNRNQGIYNMGRNVGFKVIFPFGGHKISDKEMNGMGY
jgi:iron complex outermembrane receptor protein